MKLDCDKQPIKSVTVFKSDKAEIVREFSFDLKKGKNSIELFNLANTIETKSVRASAVGGAARIIDVTCTFKDIVGGEQERALDSQLEQLVAKKDILVQENALFNHYCESLTGQNVPIEKITDFLTTFRKHREENSYNILDLSKKISELSKISSERDDYFRQASFRATVVVVLDAEEDSSTTLQLTYLVSSAKWEPIYDLHASTADDAKTVKLAYRAVIIQRSGEDWNDSTLTLSTASAQQNDIPELGIYKIRQSRTHPSIHHPRKINVLHIPQVQNHPSSFTPRPMMRQNTMTPGTPIVTIEPSFRSSSPEISTISSTAVHAASAEPISAYSEDSDRASDYELAIDNGNTPLSEEPTVIRTTSLSASFLVRGTVNIPRDGAARTVLVAPSLLFDADVTRVTVPRLRGEVYLQSKIKNTSQYHLLAGALNIFLDDGYVSQASISDTPPGGLFNCTLGVDPLVSVIYEKSSKTRKDPSRVFGDTGKATTTFTITVTIMNKHANPLYNLIVREVLPVPEDDETVKVILKKPEGLADVDQGGILDISEKVGQKCTVRWGEIVAGKGGQKEGKFEWVVNISEGGEVTLISEYDVKVPIGFQWNEVVTRHKN
ncbi:hypothetical protein C8Q75DRAFT_715913 [Abortiporus biennis]|nr:hypothetical protein C8Q75DRAFT_715913 [Abortiporus biennis]